MGDGRGHWEGNTLVVETTNFKTESSYRGSNADTLKLVERFTPVNANRISYQFTVEDPSTWTSKWSGEIPLRRFDGPLYEYACHEGNYGLPAILRGAREQEERSTR